MSLQAQTAAPPSALAVQDLVSRLAREMRIAAAVVDDCQDALVIDEDTALDPAAAIRLQGLDLVSQQLIELGRVLDGLATSNDLGRVPAALLDDVRLSDLQRRLRGEVPASAPQVDVAVW